MIEAEIISLVTTVGFPIAAFFYIAHRYEQKIEKLTVAIEELCKKVGS